MFGWKRNSKRTRHQRSSRRPAEPTHVGPHQTAHVSEAAPPILVRFCDLLILFMLVAFPFVMGGREAWGHRLLISLSLVLGATWALHKALTGGRIILLALEPLLLAGMLLLWFQVTPVSQNVINRLSPEYSRLLGEWGSTQQANSAHAQRPSAVTQTDSATSNTLTAAASDETAIGHTNATTGTSHVPNWNTASLTPVETRHGIWMLAAYAVLGIVLAQRLQTDSDCFRILKLVAVSGAAMAMFAIIQYIFSNDLFFWFYQHPYTGTKGVLKGAFTNRNHFAQFLALSLGPLLWWMLVVHRRTDNRQDHRKGLGTAHTNYSAFTQIISIRQAMLTCLVATVALTVALSLSRGGMMAAAVACIVSVAGIWKSGLVKTSLAGFCVLTGLIVIVGIMIFGHEGVESRVDQLASAAADRLDQSNARRSIWTADLNAIRAFPVTGTGVGSHREIYPVYMEDLAEFTGFEFSHAESSYVHLALETGLLGFGLLAFGLLVVISRAMFALLRSATPGSRVAAISAAIAGVLGGALHAAADFIWYAPAIVVTTIALIVAALRLSGGFTHVRSLLIPRPVWIAAAAVCGFAAVAAQPHLQQRIAGESAWGRYVLLSHSIQQAETRVSDAETQSEILAIAEEDDSLFDIGAFGSSSRQRSSNEDTADYGDDTAQIMEQDSQRTQALQQQMALLVASLKANDDQPRIRTRLAQLCLELFDDMQSQSANPLPLSQIRDAARGSGIESPGELAQWMNRAFGKHVRLLYLADRLSRDSLRQCPIQGQPYLHLLETEFLNDPAASLNEPLIHQALKLRGHDPRVHFAIGKYALSTGDEAMAMERWSTVFHTNADFRLRLSKIMATMVPASYVLINFKPDLREFNEILAVYSEQDRPADVAQILFELERKLTDNESSASDDNPLSVDETVTLLMSGQKAAEAHGMPDKAEHLMRMAIAKDASAYWPRRALGLHLYEQGQYDEAANLLLWCHNETPDDERIEWLVREARRRAGRKFMTVLPAALDSSGRINR